MLKRMLPGPMLVVAMAGAVALLQLPAFNAATAGDVASSAVDLSGQWVSTFGPVTLRQDGLSITGSYDEGSPHAPEIGTITSGSLDLSTRTVAIEFYQDWNKTKGTATFKLSQDGTLLEGTSTETGLDGSWSGSWTLRRK